MIRPNSDARRITIVGPGAIGGHFAARLMLAGHRVSVLASPRSLNLLRNQGIRYSSQDVPAQTVRPIVSDQAAELGVQDLVIVSLKSQMLPVVAPGLTPLLGPETTVLPVGNGLPWWFFAVPGQPLSGLRLRSVDPEGRVEAALPLGLVLGGSIMASCHMPAPGQVVHRSGGGITLGEPCGGRSARSAYWSERLGEAGLPTTDSESIRSVLWNKLLGNVCANPLSLLTGASTDVMLDDPGVHRIFEQMMSECIALGEALGLSTGTTALQRIAQTRKLGAIKTSMLQDREAGRPVELDAILGAPLECAAALNYPVPMMQTVQALAGLMAEQSKLWSRPHQARP